MIPCPSPTFPLSHPWRIQFRHHLQPHFRDLNLPAETIQLPEFPTRPSPNDPTSALPPNVLLPSLPSRYPPTCRIAQEKSRFLPILTSAYFLLPSLRPCTTFTSFPGDSCPNGFLTIPNPSLRAQPPPRPTILPSSPSSAISARRPLFPNFNPGPSAASHPELPRWLTWLRRLSHLRDSEFIACFVVSDVLRHQAPFLR